MVRRDPSRFLQIGFLALLFLSVLTAGYWIVENLLYTQAVHDAAEALASERNTAANTLPSDRNGAADAPVSDRNGADDAPASDRNSAATVLAELSTASEGRANRYLWEGAFFLVVLIGGMAVLTRTLRHDAELRRRQQNFLAAVSHEFKSPLASMQLAAETLVMRAGEAGAKRLGQRVLEDCERLLRMVDNLLDTTRIEEGRHVLAAETVDLTSAVGTVVESFEERAARHAINIAYSVPAAMSLAIDRTALDTILRNLVDNALKACIAGDGHNIDIQFDRSDGRIELSVSDDGLGFAPEDATRMFEKFHRLGDELRRKTPGTGLGLYIVKRLADLSAASVQAESGGPGNGATIMLSWPEHSTT